MVADEPQTVPSWWRLELLSLRYAGQTLDPLGRPVDSGNVVGTLTHPRIVPRDVVSPCLSGRRRIWSAQSPWRVYQQTHNSSVYIAYERERERERERENNLTSGPIDCSREVSLCRYDCVRACLC